MTLLDHPDALAAYGVVQVEEGAPIPLNRLSEAPPKILERQLRTGYARVRLPAGDLDVTDGDVNELEAAWGAAIGVYGGDETPRAIRVRLELADTSDWREPYIALRRASSVSSVFLTDFTCAGHREWHWPVRIATDPRGLLLVEMGAYPHPDLIELLELGSKKVACDLAVVADSGAARAASTITASLVLVVVADPKLISLDYAHNVAADFEASAVAVTTYPHDPSEFVRVFLDGLAHNHPPDLALGMAANDAEYLVIGDPEFLDAARVTAAVTEARRAIEQAWGNGLLSEADLESAITELRGLDDKHWFAEGGGATEAARRISNLQPMLAAATARRSRGRTATAEGEITPSPRYLQAQVDDRKDGPAQRRRQAFRPDSPHDVVVRVGRTSAEWNSALVEFPSWRLPPEERQYELTIDLRAPALFEGLRSEHVVLGHVGDSNTATFPVDIPANLDRVEMNVSVFYRGLHIQTAVLSGPVAEVDEDPDGKGIRLLRGDGSTVDLDAKPDIQMSFTKEKDIIKVWQQNEGTWDVDLPGIDDEVDVLRRALFDAATGVQQLETKLDEEDGLALLLTLAEHGSELRRLLVGSGDLPTVARVAVSSPASGDYIPAEFLYDFDLPDADAQLCPKFLPTKQGLCDGCLAQDSTAYVCPSGFWGLNRHIEQRVWNEARSGRDSACLAPMTSAGETTLPTAAEVIFAASNEVNADDPSRVEEAVSRLKAAIGDETDQADPKERVHLAGDWKAWKTLVAQHHPALLVALPHKVETSRRWEALQIAADKDLEIIRIERDYVTPDEQSIGPVVLLFGCNTANSQVQYQDFIHRFRCKGAAIVVGTLTYVLGPEMARVAESFVCKLWDAGGAASFGEIMQRVRAAMLREHNVMALALVAYGDADWRFMPGGH